MACRKKAPAFMGVDPGQKGAVALVSGEKALVLDLMLSGKRLDVLWFRNLVLAANLMHSSLVVVLENIHADRHFGGHRAWTMGGTFFPLCTMLTLLADEHHFTVHRPTPTQWKREVIPRCLEKVEGEPSRKRRERQKAAAVDYAREHFPTADLVRYGERKPSNDRAEALCLAEYGRRCS